MKCDLQIHVLKKTTTEKFLEGVYCALMKRVGEVFVWVTGHPD